MLHGLLTHPPENAIALIPIAQDAFADWLTQQPEPRRRWLEQIGFSAKPGSFGLLPDIDHTLAAVVVGVDASSSGDPWPLGDLPNKLPAGAYYLACDWPVEHRERAALGWALGTYRYDRYKDSEPSAAALAPGESCDLDAVCRLADAIALVRDLINTPAQDMMPAQLAAAVEDLGREFGAEVKQIVGEDLLARNYPVIHAVGRASAHAPRLIELDWGDERHPRLSLVGKGVCFDSGGLDLKSANNMRLMKKDMGGAAHTIGLARLVMAAALPVRLKLLVPAVENAVSGDAFRPGDVLRSRQGMSIEIDNTDAEGRLILCDALHAAGRPDLLIDFATLTGAARVAVGTDVPAFFSNDDALAEELAAMAREHHDPIWRLPLHKPYRELLDSKIADIVNSASSPFGGAITAALFLQEFVAAGVPWVHFDLMAWNNSTRPGRPEGGEAMGLRAVFHYLQQRYAT